MGNQPLCFFLQGGAGDINPYYATIKLQDGAVKLRDWSGQRIGEAAARLAKEILTQADPSPSIRLSRPCAAPKFLNR